MKPVVTFEDLQEGAVVSGKVRNVHAYGIFVTVNHSEKKLAGLCHISQVRRRR